MGQWLQGPIGPTGAQGLTWQGDFDPANAYVQNDAAHFTDGLKLPLRECEWLRC